MVQTTQHNKINYTGTKWYDTRAKLDKKIPALNRRGFCMLCKLKSK